MILAYGATIRAAAVERRLGIGPAHGLARYPPGACHFPQYGEDYFKQLTAERLVTRLVKGFPRSSWEKDPRRRNDCLDARVYARAAAAIYGIDRWHEARWREIECWLGLEEAATAPAPRVQPPAPKPPQRPRPLTRPAWLPGRQPNWLHRSDTRSWWDR